jgi:hypothetical protein
MPSFLAFIPNPATSLSVEALREELFTRGLNCRVERSEEKSAIEFEMSADMLYVSVASGRIDYVEHCPAFSARPPLHGRIDQALFALGFDFIDEDDPRWRAG